MRIPLTLKQLIWLIIAIVFAVFLLAGIGQSLFVYASTGSDFASALIQSLGNVLGGVIGGIVAIIVASYQVHRAFELEQTKSTRTSLTMMKLVREELKDNIAVLESAVPFEEQNHPLLKTQLSEDTWKSTMVHLTITDDLLVRLNVSYRRISLIHNLNSSDITSEFLRDTCSQLGDTLKDLNQVISRTEQAIN